MLPSDTSRPYSSVDVKETGANRALALLAVALVLSMTTWFSASAVIPQLRDAWGLSSSAGAWLTIAVQLGFVVGALVSSALNLADVFPPRLVIARRLPRRGGRERRRSASPTARGRRCRPGSQPGFFLAGVYPPALKLMATWFQRGRGVALGILVGALTLGSAVAASRQRARRARLADGDPA